MSVIEWNTIDFDPVFVQRLSRELSRITPNRGVSRQKLTVTTGGIRFDHRLRQLPVHISIMPLSEMTVWHYQEPDSTSLYLKSDVDGDVLISVSGE